MGVYVCQHFQTSIPLKPLKAKFHVEPPWDGGINVCSNGPDHMTKMAALLLYGKNFKTSASSEPKGRVCSNDESGLTLTYFRARSNLSLMLLYGKMVKQ